jgi:hypothetical protein
MKHGVFAKGLDLSHMLLLICFFMGVANFALHKAVAESGHPYVEEAKRHFGALFGPYGSYMIELALLIGAMWLANTGSVAIAVMYSAYTAINGIATWLLLSDKE